MPAIVEPEMALKEHKEFTYLDSPKFAAQGEDQAGSDQAAGDRQEDAGRDEPGRRRPRRTRARPPAPAQRQLRRRFRPASSRSRRSRRPAPPAVPARPNFAMGSQNPADQLRDAMKNAARRSRRGQCGQPAGSGGLSVHPGAGSGGVEVLSDTQGVDFNSWLQRWHWETERTWDPLIPDEVNAPILKSGMVAIRFKVLPNGRLMDGSMVLEGRSGDVALDRAAWGALTGSNYPPLPRDFHGPYLELRAFFLYNMEAPR